MHKFSQAIIVLFSLIVFCDLSLQKVEGIDIPAYDLLPDLLADAAKRHDAVDTSGWAFSVKKQTEKEELFETFDPSLPENNQWQLWMINGRPPSPKALTQYSKKEKPSGNDLLKPLGIHTQESKTFEKEKKESDELTSDVHRRSVTGNFVFDKLNESPNIVEYQVDLSQIKLEYPNKDSKDSNSPKPSRSDIKKSKGLEKLIKNIDCRVIVNKSPAFIKEFQFSLKNDFSPATGIRINQFSIKTQYQTVGDNLDPLVKKLDFNVKGKALKFIPFQLKRISEFSNFRKVISTSD